MSLSAAGTEIRDRAVAALSRRHAELLDRAKRRALTEVERREVDRLGVVIDTLQSMGDSAAT